MFIRKFSPFLFLFVLASCNSGSSNQSNSDLDDEVRTLIASKNLIGDPAQNRILPNIKDPLPQLGMKLFYSKSLGGDSDSACVTCHHPVLGGGDNLPLPIGVQAVDPDTLGEGRIHRHGGLTVPRNAPTTFNMGLWDKVLFWDGRVESLGKTPNVNGNDGSGIRTPDSGYLSADPLTQNNLTSSQARFPITSAEEMRGFSFVQGGSNEEVRTALSQRLSANQNWVEEFRIAFGSGDIDYPRIANAIGAYERSQVFTNTPWKRYVQGDNGAISESAKRGAKLFYSSTENGGANCAKCHAGDFFTDESFWILASPQLGTGKGDGYQGTNDFGRARETKSAEDRFAFRVPTLLNVEVTGPYFHSGAFTELADVVSHHLNPSASLQSYDVSKAPRAANGNFSQNSFEALNYAIDNPDKAIGTIANPIEFSSEQILDIVSFLQTLTDPCVKSRECLSPWILDTSDGDPDGTRLIAKDGGGNVL